MKTKTSLWLGVCTLVLCLGVMTFGVYSAINAQLNIGGSLGFNMHDCMITVSGTIQNVAVSTDNWVTAEPTTLNIERTVMGGESKTTTNINLDPLYFYAKENMIFEFTFTNISETSIAATIPLPTVDGTAVEIVTGTTNGYTNFTDENNTYKASIPVGSSTKVSFALHLEDGDALATGLANFSWTNITFEEAGFKLDMIQSAIIQNTADAYYGEGNTTYYFIEMGTNPITGEKLRWYAFAKYDTEEGIYKQHHKTTQPTAGTYYFISEYILDALNDNYGMNYNFYDYSTYDSSTPLVAPAVYYNGGTATVKDNYPVLSVNTNDYSVSNVRAYLNDDANNPAYRTYDGNTANAGSAQKYLPNPETKLTGSTSFKTRFGLTDDEIYNNYITGRPLDGSQDGATFSLYSDIATDGNTTNTPDKTKKISKDMISTTKTINGNNITTNDADTDKLWCLSFYEAYNLLGNQTTQTTSTDAYKKSFKLPTVQGTPSTSTGSWWLRTPYSSYASNAYGVRTAGTLNASIVYGTFGARPAFQITIS